VALTPDVCRSQSGAGRAGGRRCNATPANGLLRFPWIEFTGRGKGGQSSARLSIARATWRWGGCNPIARQVTGRICVLMARYKRSRSTAFTIAARRASQLELRTLETSPSTPAYHRSPPRGRVGPPDPAAAIQYSGRGGRPEKKICGCPPVMESAAGVRRDVQALAVRPRRSPVSSSSPTPSRRRGGGYF
jgi:hypothetical protein